MVFGFLLRRQSTQTAVAGESASPKDTLAELPRLSSPENVVDEDAAKGTSEGPTHIHAQVAQLQLRTPSPSVSDSVSVAQGARRASEALGGIPESIRPLLEPTPESLTALILSIPAKTLHAYTLAQIPGTEQPVIDALATFFATLTPPPRLHCVRCHKDYTEVENDDRSCLVPHDDESAEVERVGRGGHERKTKEGTEYETLWGCCGKTTEGDGSQGPPDGWCYEGKHTTDVKRARFRADSSPQNDKLVSCLRLNCHGIRARMPRGSSTRKRVRKAYKEASSDGEDSSGASDSGIDEIAGKAREAKPKTPARPKPKAKSQQQPDDAMDVDAAPEESVSIAESASKEKDADASSAPAKRPRGRPRKSLPAPDAEASPSTSARAPKRRGRAPKTAATVEDSEPETSRGRGTASPVRRDAERRRTRSLSRTRAAEESAAAPAWRAGHKPKSRSRTKMAEVVNGARSDSGEADDEQPKKRRKVGPA
ncbi:hypothetical protein PsYK624_034960 [Phanerochaete sordida]|uniref:Uncharacterized protein n=1 Tax=Phanerochaete sordida TaxID=48140 RepID=A0A9P3G362_9APHY|nr:hypothetical protein PsYK624_034960 [Phanerochaete sordida]